MSGPQFLAALVFAVAAAMHTGTGRTDADGGDAGMHGSTDRRRVRGREREANYFPRRLRCKLAGGGRGCGEEVKGRPLVTVIWDIMRVAYLNHTKKSRLYLKCYIQGSQKGEP